jgi:hypothetical protein
MKRYEMVKHLIKTIPVRAYIDAEFYGHYLRDNEEHRVLNLPSYSAFSEIEKQKLWSSVVHRTLKSLNDGKTFHLVSIYQGRAYYECRAEGIIPGRGALFCLEQGAVGQGYVFYKCFNHGEPSHTISTPSWREMFIVFH